MTLSWEQSEEGGSDTTVGMGCGRWPQRKGRPLANARTGTVERIALALCSASLLVGGQALSPSSSSAQSASVVARVAEYGRMRSATARALVREVERVLAANATRGGTERDRLRVAAAHVANRQNRGRMGPDQVYSLMREGLSEELLEAMFAPGDGAAMSCAADFGLTMMDCDALQAAAVRRSASLPHMTPDDGSVLRRRLREAGAPRARANEIVAALRDVMIGVPKSVGRDPRGEAIARLLSECPGGHPNRESQVRAWHVGPNEGLSRCIARTLAGRGRVALAMTQGVFGMSREAAENFLRWGSPPAQPSPAAAMDAALTAARNHYRDRRYGEAARAYEAASEADPNNPRVLAGLGSARLHAGDHRGAIAAYQLALRRAPREANLHAMLGDAFRVDGQLEQATAAYRRALDLNSEHAGARRALTEIEGAARAPAPSAGAQAEALRQQGRAHFAARRFAEAAAAYGRASQLAPDHAGGFAGLGAALLSSGDSTEAARAYQAAARLAPNHSGYLTALARALVRNGDRPGAAAALSRALELDPSNRSAQAGLRQLGVAPPAGRAPAAQPPAAIAPPAMAAAPPPGPPPAGPPPAGPPPAGPPPVGPPSGGPPPAGPPPGPTLPEVPARAAIVNVMRPLQSAVQGCDPDASGQLVFRVVVRGETGEVVTAALEPEDASSEMECMLGVVRGAVFPRFSREELSIAYPYQLP